jgi:hypothetical protein
MVAVCVLPTLSGPEAADAAQSPTVVTAVAPLNFTTTADAVDAPLASPEGPGVVSPTVSVAPRGTSGEGVFWLTAGGPGTQWSSALNTSVVVDVRIDGGTAQQVVLFDGATPFTYTGFVGSLNVGTHVVQLVVDRGLSATTTVPPQMVLSRFTLAVVPRSSPEYTEVAYAPVLYGRTSSARSYTPLLVSASDSNGTAGSHQLQYVLVISAHDQGDSIVPAYQWGLWGRMTDIVTILNETISSSGATLSASYASCGCESLPYFPDFVMAPEETTAPVQSADYDSHPVLRDATATNYLSDKGTTRFRFQQLPVAAPPSGQLRDAVMDEHPWTYQISNEELPREHVISTDPDDLLVGDYRQYGIVDSDLSVTGTVAVEFALQLAGDPVWYSTDYQQMTAGIPSTFVFNNGGHTRSAIKLPLNWESRPVVGFRIRLEVAPGSSVVPTIVVHSLELLAVTPGWNVVPVPLPKFTVVRSTALDPEPLPS